MCRRSLIEAATPSASFSIAVMKDGRRLAAIVNPPGETYFDAVEVTPSADSVANSLGARFYTLAAGGDVVRAELSEVSHEVIAMPGDEGYCLWQRGGVSLEVIDG